MERVRDLRYRGLDDDPAEILTVSPRQYDVDSRQGHL